MVTPRRSVDQCLQTSIHLDQIPLTEPQSTHRFIPRLSSRHINTDDYSLTTNDPSITRSKSADRLLNNHTKISNSNKPSQSSTSPSSTTHQLLPLISSLPDLSFIHYYARENPAPLLLPSSTLTTQTKHDCSRIKNTLSDPSSLTKKATRTVFYCSVKAPSIASSSSIPLRPTTLHSPISSIQRPRTLKEIKRIRSIKTSPTTIANNLFRTLPSNSCVSSNVDRRIKEEETATFSSTCSSTSTSANSTSSSGYFSNSSTNHPRHNQTPTSSSYPLKSCLKRAKTEDLTSTPSTTTANVLAVGAAGDIFTLTARTLTSRLSDNNMETSRHRRYSAPSISSYHHNLSIQLYTQRKGCTLSEHDLRAKKSVSFCDDIVRRLITPSASPKHRPTPPPTVPFRYDRGIDHDRMKYLKLFLLHF